LRAKPSKLTVPLKDESLEYSANLPGPGVLALEISEDLEAVLAQAELLCAGWTN
jgi:hypothetical protein